MFWVRYYEISPGSNKYIYIPTEKSRAIGSFIIENLQSKWEKPQYYYHFRKGGHLAAIKTHLSTEKARTFSIFDLSGYYNQITRSKLIRVLKKYVGYEQAQEWATQSTLIHKGSRQRVLPLGFVQSVFLASLVLDNCRLGFVLREISSQKDMKVSVFVDDIIISSVNKKRVSYYSKKIQEAARKSNFTFQTKKTFCNVDDIRVFNLYCSQGINLDFSKDRLDSFRAALIENLDNKFVVWGLLAYMMKVNPNTTKSLINSIVQEIGINNSALLGECYYKYQLNPQLELWAALRQVCFAS